MLHVYPCATLPELISAADTRPCMPGAGCDPGPHCARGVAAGVAPSVDATSGPEAIAKPAIAIATPARLRPPPTPVKRGIVPLCPAQGAIAFIPRRSLTRDSRPGMIGTA